MIEEIIEDLFGGFKMTKKRMAIIFVYLLGALFTNSYCRNCRWGDWDKFDNPEWRELNQGAVRDLDPILATTAATIFWPVYVASRASDSVVAYASKVDVAVEWK